MRRCFSCKVEKDFDDFTRNGREAGGRGYECRACRNARRRARSPEQKRAERLRWKNANREKHRAQKALQKAVARGVITRPDSCERCGGGPVQAHHADYEKRFEVAWLCPRCHGEEHTGWSWPAAA